MYKIIDVTGQVGSECHLLLSDKAAVLVESGCSYCAQTAADNIKRELGGRKLDAILLTHSHFDHAGGAPVIKRNFPEAQVVASEYAAKILAKESARKLIRELDIAAARQAKLPPGPDTTGELHVDITVKDGDTVQFGDMKIRTLEAPGHTKCSVCYYFEGEDLFVSCETMGVAPTYPDIMPCYVIGYNLTMNTIDHMRKELKPRHILMTHRGLIPDEDCATFFDRCQASVLAARDLIVGEYEKGAGLDEIIEAYKQKFYDGTVENLQSLDAFYANARVEIPRTLADCGYTLEEG